MKFFKISNLTLFIFSTILFLFGVFSFAMHTAWATSVTDSVTVFVTPSGNLPDLTASTPSPATVAFGIPTTFTSVITNQGPSSTQVSFPNVFQISQDKINITTNYETTPYTTALAGSAFASSVKSITLSGGTYMRACADNPMIITNGIVAEENEGNNCSEWVWVDSSSSDNLLNASNCDIPAGSNTCNSNLNWSTINPVKISAITTRDNITIANSNSGSASYPVYHGSRTFYLYNNGIELKNATAIASCVLGTSWDGSICKTGFNGNPSPANNGLDLGPVSINGKEVDNSNTVRLPYNSIVTLALVNPPQNTTSCSCTHRDNTNPNEVACAWKTPTPPYTYRSPGLKKDIFYTVSCLAGGVKTAPRTVTVLIDPIKTTTTEH